MKELSIEVEFQTQSLTTEEAIEFLGKRKLEEKKSGIKHEFPVLVITD